MCSYSVIADDFMRQHRWVEPAFSQPAGPTREEFERLRNDVEALKELLKAAKKYDAAVGHAECENDEKVALLKRIAELVGVDLGEALNG